MLERSVGASRVRTRVRTPDKVLNGRQERDMNTERAEIPTGSQDFKDLLRTSLWGFKLMWQLSKTLFIASLGLMVVRGALPAALALVVRGLVDTVVALGDNGSDGQVLNLWVLGAFALALTEGLSGYAQVYVHRRMADELQLRVSTDMMRHATTLDLAFFESPTNRDLIERAVRTPATGWPGS